MELSWAGLGWAEEIASISGFLAVFLFFFSSFSFLPSTFSGLVLSSVLFCSSAVAAAAAVFTFIATKNWLLIRFFSLSLSLLSLFSVVFVYPSRSFLSLPCCFYGSFFFVFLALLPAKVGLLLSIWHLIKSSLFVVSVSFPSFQSFTLLKWNSWFCCSCFCTQTYSVL